MASKTAKAGKSTKVSTASFYKRHFFEIILVAFCFLLFATSLRNGYNLDDELVTINHRLTSKGISAIPEIFTSTYYKDNSGYAYEYRPIVLVSFAVEHQLFGDNAFISHFINLLLYCLLCFILYRLLLVMKAGFGSLFAFFVTLLFIAHSSHTEVVCSIKNRDEILGLIFGFSAIYAAFKAVNTGRAWLFALVPFAFFMALLNKVTFLPFAIIVPLSVLFFTNISAGWYFTVVFLLLAPAFYVVNIPNSLYMKLEIIGALFAVNLATFVVIRFEKIKLLITELVADKSLPDDLAKSESFKGWVGALLPPKEVFSILPITVTFLLTGLFCLGLYYHIYILSIPCILILLFLVFRGSLAWMWWAHLVMFIILTAPLFLVKLNYDRVYATLIVQLLAFVFFWGNNSLRLPALLPLLLITVVRVVVHYEPVPLFFITIIGVLRFYRLTLPALIFAATLLGFYFFMDVKQLSEVFSPVVLFGSFKLPLALLVVLLVFRWGGKWLVWLGAVGALVYFLGIWIHDNPALEIRNSIEKVGHSVNTSIILDKQDRPIDFVEQPVKPEDTWQVKTGTSFRVLMHYFTKVIIPYPLAYYYGYRFIKPEHITDPVPLTGVIVYALLVMLGIYFLFKNRLLSYSIAVYLIAILTFSNIVVMIPGIVADRYLLLPSLGWCIMLVLLLFSFFKMDMMSESLDLTKLPTGFRIVYGAFLIFYTLVSFFRIFDWYDDITLFRKDIKYVHESAQANNLLALHLMIKTSKMPAGPEQVKITEEALGYFKKTLEIAPNMFNATYDVARVYNILNKKDSAVIYYNKAIAIDSTFLDAYMSASELLFQLGKLNEAIPYCEYIIRTRPTEARAYGFLSYLYYQLHQYDKSISVNREALKYLPGNVDPLVNIGRVYQTALNRNDSAIYYYQKAYAINPLPELKQNIEAMGGKAGQ